MKKFEIKTRYIFEGIFTVNAENMEQALEFSQKHCGIVIGGDMHTSLPNGTVHWDYNVYPEEEIESIRQIVDSQADDEMKNQINRFSCMLAEKELIDKYNLLFEDLINKEDMNFRPEYKDDFYRYYNHYYAKLCKLIFREVIQL